MNTSPSRTSSLGVDAGAFVLSNVILFMLIFMPGVIGNSSGIGGIVMESERLIDVRGYGAGVIPGVGGGVVALKGWMGSTGRARGVSVLTRNCGVTRAGFIVEISLRHVGHNCCFSNHLNKQSLV